MPSKLNLMNVIKFLGLFALFFFHANVYAQLNFDADLEEKVNFFSTVTCDDKEVKKIYKNKPRPNRLLLIDATDPLTDGQKQYLRDNYIDGIDWQNKGEKFSMVLLDNKNISKLDRVTFCSPMREDQISFFDAKTTELEIIDAYKDTLNKVFNLMVNQDTTANSTKLIETLYAIYTNQRFNFQEGKRILLVTSDLLQISKEIDLRCKGGRCPRFKDTLEANKSWFQVSQLELRKNDVVEMYYFQAKCKVNIQRLEWWHEYFLNQGISKENLFVRAENGGSDDECEPISGGNSRPGGPGVGDIKINFNTSTNGVSGFTQKLGN